MKRKEKNEEPGDATVPTTSQKIKTKSAQASTVRNPSPRNEEAKEDEVEEDVATHLGGAEPLTDHFTMANATSDKDN